MRNATIAVLLAASFGTLFYFQAQLWRLQAQNRALKTERGDLTLIDPAKINSRLVFTDGKNRWRWRVYLPAECKYQMNLSFLDSDEIDKGNSREVGSGTLPAGEHSIEVEMLKSEADGVIETTFYWPKGHYPCSHNFRTYNRDTVDNALVTSGVGSETSLLEFDQDIVLFHCTPREKGETMGHSPEILFGVRFEQPARGK